MTLADVPHFWLQALHAMCLAHFEADQAAGGNLYAKFARCYLQLAEEKPNQPSSKSKAEGALFSDQVCCLLGHPLFLCLVAPSSPPRALNFGHSRRRVFTISKG